MRGNHCHYLLAAACVCLAVLALCFPVAIAADQSVLAAEAQAGEQIGSGDGSIHVIPSLSAPSVKNGGQLKIQALVKAVEGVKRVEATIERSENKDAKPVATIILKPASTSIGGVCADGTLGVWQAEWEARGLSEGCYTVAVRITDGAGHEFTDRSLRFSDPIAGNNAPGSALSPVTRKDAVQLNLGEDYLGCAVIDTSGVNAYAYFGTRTRPGQVVKVRLSDFTRVGALTLEGEEDTLESAAIDTSAGYAYFGTNNGSIDYVVKVALGSGDNPPTRVGALALQSGEIYFRCAVIDTSGGYVYFGGGVDPGKVVKIRLSDFTRVGAVTLESGEAYISCAVIDTSAGYAYFGTDTDPGKVVKIQLSSFTRVGAVTLNSQESYLGSAVIDAATGYGYFGTNYGYNYAIPDKVVKVRLSDLTRVGAASLNSGEYNLRSAVIDTLTSCAYFGTDCDTEHDRVVKVSLGSGTNAPSRADAISLYENDLGLDCAVVDESEGYAYFGMYTAAGRVTSVNLTSFVLSSHLILNVGENEVVSAVTDDSAGYMYFGTDTSPGRVVKVRKSDFTRVGALTLNLGEDYLRAGVIDVSGGYAYFGTYTYPAQVVKVRLSDFTRVGAITLGGGEQNLSSGVIDVSGGYAYFGTYEIPGKIAKVRLSDFTPVATLTLSAGEDNLRSGVIDASAGYAYFGTSTSPGKVVKIKLSNFTCLGSLTLDSGEDWLRSAVIDAAAGYAYFGTDTWPAQVVKVALGSGDNLPTRTGAVTVGSQEYALATAVIDTAGGYAYFGTADYPGRVVKVALGSGSNPPTRVGGAVCGPGENKLGCGVIDVPAGYAYFGTGDIQSNESDAGDVVRFSLSQKGFVKATRFTMPEQGLVTSVHFYSHEATGTVRLAIYEDTTPNTLLWQSGEISNSATNDFVTALISSGTPSSLQLNVTTYWLAWQINAVDNVASYTEGTSGQGFYAVQPYGAFPATIDTDSRMTTNEAWTEYITYDAISGILEWRRY